MQWKDPLTASPSAHCGNRCCGAACRARPRPAAARAEGHRGPPSSPTLRCSACAEPPEQTKNRGGAGGRWDGLGGGGGGAGRAGAPGPARRVPREPLRVARRRRRGPLEGARPPLRPAAGAVGLRLQARRPRRPLLRRRGRGGPRREPGGRFRAGGVVAEHARLLLRGHVPAREPRRPGPQSAADDGPEGGLRRHGARQGRGPAARLAGAGARGLPDGRRRAPGRRGRPAAEPPQARVRVDALLRKPARGRLLRAGRESLRHVYRGLDAADVVFAGPEPESAGRAQPARDVPERARAEADRRPGRAHAQVLHRPRRGAGREHRVRGGGDAQRGGLRGAGGARARRRGGVGVGVAARDAPGAPGRRGPHGAAQALGRLGPGRGVGLQLPPGRGEAAGFRAGRPRVAEPRRRRGHVGLRGGPGGEGRWRVGRRRLLRRAVITGTGARRGRGRAAARDARPARGAPRVRDGAHARAVAPPLLRRGPLPRRDPRLPRGRGGGAGRREAAHDGPAPGARPAHLPRRRAGPAPPLHGHHGGAELRAEDDLVRLRRRRRRLLHPAAGRGDDSRQGRRGDRDPEDQGRLLRRARPRARGAAVRDGDRRVAGGLRLRRRRAVPRHLPRIARGARGVRDQGHAREGERGRRAVAPGDARPLPEISGLGARVGEPRVLGRDRRLPAPRRRVRGRGHGRGRGQRHGEDPLWCSGGSSSASPRRSPPPRR